MAEPKNTPDAVTEVEALRAQLEALQAEKAERERVDLGLAEGKLICNTPGCDFGERTVDFQKTVHERRDPETGVLENSVTDWVQHGDKVCPNCQYALAEIVPGAVSAFPVGYRFQYPEPIR